MGTPTAMPPSNHPTTYLLPLAEPEEKSRPTLSKRAVAATIVSASLFVVVLLVVNNAELDQQSIHESRGSESIVPEKPVMIEESVKDPNFFGHATQKTDCYTKKGVLAQKNKATICCKHVEVDTLVFSNKNWRSFRACYPTRKGKFPLHVFAHGDGAGGPSTKDYYPLLRHLAHRGFVAVAFHSCENDSACDDGHSSFLEIYKVIRYLKSPQGRKKVSVDHSKKYSLSGHSTGGRSVLTIAARKDHPEYRKETYDTYQPPCRNVHCEKVTDMKAQLHAITMNIGAVFAASGDAMYQESGEAYIEDYEAMGMDNPWVPIAGAKDAKLFDITTVPVMTVGSAGDCLEPPQSSWKNFQLVSSPNKIFMNIAHRNHMDIATYPPLWELIARWSRAHVLNDAKAEASLYNITELQAELKFSIANPDTAPRVASDGTPAFQEPFSLPTYAGTSYVGCSANHTSPACKAKTLADVVANPEDYPGSKTPYWTCASMFYTYSIHD